MVERLQSEEGGEMKCIHCQGEMKRGTTPFHIDRKGCHLMLDAVPAWVCEQCGEGYFEEREVDAIQEFVRLVEEKADAFVMTG
ncbi:MAG: YgiT-type zinc finger protein [Planctomycetota bacterium]